MVTYVPAEDYGSPISMYDDFAETKERDLMKKRFEDNRGDPRLVSPVSTTSEPALVNIYIQCSYIAHVPSVYLDIYFKCRENVQFWQVLLVCCNPV